MPLTYKSRHRQINHSYTQTKILLTIFLIIILGINSSFASQTIKSEVNETKQGSKFQYKINTPTFWDINQTHNVTISFEIDSFGHDIEIIEGEIGLHVKDNNNFTHYYGFHSFGPFIDIKSNKDINRMKNKIIYQKLPPILYEALKDRIDTVVYDVYDRIIPVKHNVQFTIDLFLFDLPDNVSPTTIGFYLAFNFYETTIDNYGSEENDVNDPSIIQKMEWIKVAEFRIDPSTNKRSIPIWFWVAAIVLLFKFGNSKKK